jgi:hypothetical protein
MSKVQLSKSLIYLAALLSFLLSVYLFFLAGTREQGIFVGLWVPSILSLGTMIFNGRQLSRCLSSHPSQCCSGRPRKTDARSLKRKSPGERHNPWVAAVLTRFELPDGAPGVSPPNPLGQASRDYVVRKKMLAPTW